MRVCWVQGWQVYAGSLYKPVFTMVKTGWHKLVFATYWQKLAKTKNGIGFFATYGFLSH